MLSLHFSGSVVRTWWWNASKPQQRLPDLDEKEGLVDTAWWGFFGHCRATDQHSHAENPSQGQNIRPGEAENEQHEGCPPSTAE